MIEFGGLFYYLDLEAFDKTITPKVYKPTDKLITTEKRIYKDADGAILNEEITETSMDRGKEIDAAKFEVLRTMIEIVLEYNEEVDTTLGIERALNGTPLSFKMAFNTLINYGIIKGKE